MSVNYGAGIIVGYRFQFDDAVKPFKVVIGKNKFKKVPRFDPASGKKVAPERVQTEFSYIKYVWKKLSTTADEEAPEGGWPDDQEVGVMDFVEKLAEANGFEATSYGEGSTDDYQVVFSPKKHPERTGEGFEDHRFSAGGNLSWAAVADMGAELMRLRKKLVQLGLKPGEPEVVLAWDAS